MASTTYAGGDLFNVPSGMDPSNLYFENNPVTVVLSNGNILLTWENIGKSDGYETQHVMGMILDADGNEVTSPFMVNTSTAEQRYAPSATALSGGGFVITWVAVDQDGDGDGVYMQRFNNAGVPQGSETLISDVTSGDQDGAYVVGLSGGGFYVFWSSIQDNGDGTFTTDLIGQEYTSGGAEVGTELTVSSEVSNEFIVGSGLYYNSISAVELTGGEIAISWTNANYTVGPSKTRIAIIDDTGALVPGFVEPEQTDDGPSHPQENIVALGNGNLLVVYSYGFSSGGTGASSNYGQIYGRIYDETLTAVGDEFEIAGGTANPRFQNNVSSDGNGGAVIVYVQRHEVSGDYNLMMQHITQSGNVKGDAVHIGEFGSTRFGEPSLDILPSGDLVIAWHTGLGPSSINYRIIRNGEDVRFSNSADTVVLNDTGEAVVALQGSDSVEGGTGDDVVSSGTGHDTVTGEAGDDVLYGGSGRDELHGNGDNDLIFGGDGDDTLYGGANEDIIDGGNHDDLIFGGADIDTIHGGDGENTIHGDEGDDVLYANTDQYSVNEPGEVVGGTYGGSTVYGGDGNDRINGSRWDDVIDGGEGNDNIFGSQLVFLPSGRDYLIASNGDDTYRMKDSDDVVDYSNFGAAIIATWYRPGLSLESIKVLKTAYTGYGEQEDTLYDVARLIGTGFSDYIQGDEFLVSIHGGMGDDTLVGTDNSDRFLGEGGSDTLYGGGGHDSLFGGDDADELNGGGQGDYLRGADGFDVLAGNGGADELIGGGGGDTLFGGGGGDTLNGGDSHDSIEGGAGSDTIDGGSSGDILRGNADQDTIFGGQGVDSIYGGSSRDELRGNTENDRIFGGKGSDRLYGDSGDDTLEGGLGDDFFVFDGNAADGTDTIRDFEDGGDILEIGGSVVFADLTISVVSGHTHVDWTGNTIILKHISTGITEDDFLFV